MASRPPDIDPVARVLAGGDEDFAAMLGRHRTFLLRVAASIVGPEDAEDVVQEACLRAWRGRAAFDGRAPGGWLATIARHAATDMLRRRHFVTVVLDHLPERADPAQEPEPAALAREVGEAIAAALATIPRDQADAVLRCCGDGQKYREAAGASGVPVTTIRARLNKARVRLRGLLAGGDG